MTRISRYAAGAAVAGAALVGLTMGTGTAQAAFLSKATAGARVRHCRSTTSAGT